MPVPTSLLFLGASRNVGHMVADLLLVDPIYETTNLTLLLRRPLPEGDSLLPFVESGRVKIVFGDALDAAAVKNAWETAGGAKCDGVLFTVGTPPSDVTMSGISIRIKTANLTTVAMLNLLAAIRATPGAPQPSIIAVSSLGLGSEAKHLTWILRATYRYLLHGPHVDKLGLEYLVRAAAINPFPIFDGLDKPTEDILPQTALDSALPVDASGSRAFLQDLTIVRPAFYVDAPDQLRATERKFVVGEGLNSPKTISREETARFIFEDCLPGREGREKWVGKAVDVARLTWW